MFVGGVAVAPLLQLELLQLVPVLLLLQKRRSCYIVWLLLRLLRLFLVNRLLRRLLSMVRMLLLLRMLWLLELL